MSSTRRAFLSTAMAMPATWTAFTSAVRATPSGGEAYWQMVQRQFPLEDRLIYLNAANVCPASRPVMDRHLEYLRDFHSNPSFQNRDKYEQMRESLRGKAARLLRVSADEVAVTRNTSEGSNIVVKGINLKPGDEVIITSHNHPSNNDSWKVRARRDGFTVKPVPTPVPASSADALFSAIEKAITPRTRVIAITHVTSTTGVLYPAREIAALARNRGIWMHLDGAQTFGCLDVDLARIGCDSYATSAHKWLMGPLEAGLLFVRAERIPELWPSIVTAGWAEDLKGARKLEVFGQRDDPRVVALEAALDFVSLIGMSNVEARTRTLATRAKEALKALPSVELKTNMEGELSGGVVKFKLRNVATKHAYDTLWQRHRISTSMTASGESEGLRFSPHIYNSLEQIDQAVAAVKELAV
ncbi:MAG TPA: aminotransferase class V-fold PLP-dependent enzyme [Bryobacteraceae bacterium]|jgi:selenocysteine lyase/cysteine desulfurase|nr:aminotransferase class V-fold PLP-dependent enzyme [Bryobacteraceae bacterium]